LIFGIDAPLKIFICSYSVYFTEPGTGDLVVDSPLTGLTFEWGYTRFNTINDYLAHGRGQP
jgi:hypothetical protein